MLVSLILSGVVYISAIIFLGELINVEIILQWIFIRNILILIVISFLPIFTLKYLIKFFAPNDYEKIMSGVSKFRWITKFEN